ncbi:hypothetical protein COL154_011979 [Colletotrichum chrysophilum]|nr:hypothetical protein COL154_011979 [Colletotrichum chrysophilum]
MDSEFSVEKAREQFPSLQKDQIFGDNAGGSQVLGSVAHRFSQLRVIGASTTQVLRNLAASIKLEAGDELILSEIDHESNIDPWLHYAQIAGANIKWWSPADRSNPKLDAKTLQSLLTTKTRLVACTHASNILGSIHDIKAIADTIHEIPDALLCVDGVAYAPHRAIDVKELGADFYAFSWYKNPKKTWDEITQHEEKLQKRLIEYLDSRPDISIRGETSSEAAVRLPTSNIGIRWGHFFSKRLAERTLGLDDDGVVRVSLVHYNTGE